MSIYFQNRYLADKSKIETKYYLFQPSIEIQPLVEPYGILSWDHAYKSSGDPLYEMEKKKFEMLYRKKREFGVGHNSAVQWEERYIHPENSS